MDNKELDPESAKEQLLSLLGKMVFEADKIKVMISELDKNPEFAKKIPNHVFRVCASGVGCICNASQRA
jgi:hypothetical protein